MFFFKGFLNYLPNRKMNSLIVLETNTFSRETNAFCASGELFRAGDECVENVRSNSTPPHTATYMYVTTSDFQTELLSRLLLIGTHL